MGQQDWNLLGKHIFKPNAPIDARELVNSDSDIVNIDSAYVGMIVTVNSNPIKRYKIKKVTWEGHPDSIENGGYELIQEPKDLKYSDGVTSFLNNNGNIDADYLKFADIDGSEEEKSTEDDFNVKTDTLRIDGTTYENSKKLSIRNTIGALENITSMQNVQPVIEALNNRTAKIDQQTNEVRALGYKVLNPNLSFAEQVEGVKNANMIFEIKDSFDLNGGSVTIPAGCTLRFNGGNISNGRVNLADAFIDSDRLCFGEGLLPIDNSTKLSQNIKPEWFGATGAGQIDDTDAWERCIEFASCFSFTGFRNYTHNNATIEGNGRYLITRQLWIGAPFDIIGGFKFNYKGDYPPNGEGVINFYGEQYSFITYEFGLTHIGLTNTTGTFTPDWREHKSIGISFGNTEEYNGQSTKTLRYMEHCTIKLFVNGFHTCVKCKPSGGNTAVTSLTITDCVFTKCVYGINNCFTNGAWNNCWKFLNNEFRPTGAFFVDENIDSCAFIYINGTSGNHPTYNMQASLIDGVQLEGRPSVTAGTETTTLNNLLLLQEREDDVPIALTNLTVRHLRVENTGVITNTVGLIIKTNGFFENCYCDNVAFANRLVVSTNGYVTDSATKDVPGWTVKGADAYDNGIIIDEEVKSNSRTYIGSYIFNRRIDNMVMASQYNLDNVVTTQSAALPSGYTALLYYMLLKHGEAARIKIKKGSLAIFIKKETDGKTIDYNQVDYSLFDNISFAWNKTSTSSPTVFGKKCLTKSVKEDFVIRNIHNTDDYYIIFYVYNNSSVEICKNEIHAIDELNITYPLKGTSNERPQMLQYRNKGLIYVDTTIGETLTWNGYTYITDNKTIPQGKYQDLPAVVASPLSTYRYYDTDHNKLLHVIPQKTDVQSIALSKHGEATDKTFISLQSGRYYIGVNPSKIEIYLSKKNDYSQLIDGDTKILRIFDGTDMYVESFEITSDDLATYPYLLFINTHNINKTLTISTYSVIWVDENGYSPDAINIGTSDNRPSASTIAAGFQYYDTNLGKPIYWNGSSWTDANGETVGLQVSDTSVLIGAAAGSKTVSVYYGGSTAPTITVLNSDDTANTWLTATPDPFTGNTLTLTAGLNDTSAPRGAKVLVTLGDELVIINVVQSY